MAFPTDRDGLKAAGYVFSNHGRCRGCREEVEWYETPNKKKIPMNLMAHGSSLAVSHFTTCPKRDEFRKER